MPLLYFLITVIHFTERNPHNTYSLKSVKEHLSIKNKQGQWYAVLQSQTLNKLEFMCTCYFE